MAPSRKKGGRAASAAAAAATRQQWKVGDLVLAKMKGFPAWPAMVSEPEKWGYKSDRKKLLVYFYGTKQIAFCNYADIEAFTEEKKKSLLVKRQGKGADFVRAVDEIIDIYEKSQRLTDVNSGDEDNKPNNGHLECSRSKSSTRSPKISPRVNNVNQSEAPSISTENHDSINPEEFPRSSIEGDPHNTGILNNAPAEKVSILDQLRQTPLSTTTTTRKRQRDGSLQGSVIHRVPSFRRSRSSSGGDPYMFQKSSVTVNGSVQGGSNLVSDVLQEESTLKKMLMGDAAHVAQCCNGGLSVSSCLPFKESGEDILSDKSTTRSDAEEDSVSESRCKLEESGNGYLDKNLGSNGDVTLNGKLDLPIKAAILKKKRKPNRKRATNSLEHATLDKEVDLQVELHESLSESPNSRKEVAENFSKTDGDEHLPLVKRARVRMGKPSIKETQVGEFVEKKEKLESVSSLEESDTCIKSSSPGSFPADKTLFRVKEEARSSLVNDCAPPGKDQMIWTVKKFQLKGMTLDVEAALPPSKRLHRALEAMSANAAEATNNAPEAPSDMEIICKGISNSPKANPLDQPADGTIESPRRSQCIKSSGSTASHNKSSGFSSILALADPKVSLLKPSEWEPDNSLTQSFRSPQKKDCEELVSVEGCDGPCTSKISVIDIQEPVDSLTQSFRSPQKEDCEELVVSVEGCDGPCTSKISVIDIQEKVLQPCSVKSVEDQPNTTSNEDTADQLSSPSVVENDNEYENETFKISEKCSYPEAEGEKESGNTVRDLVHKPDSVTNSKVVIELLPPNGSAEILTATDITSTTSNTSGSTKSPSSQSDESIQTRDMSDGAGEGKCKVTPKDWGTSDVTPMKNLIAAAQAKRLLSRSTSFPDNVVDGKVLADSAISPSIINRGNSSVRGSPQNPMVYHRPATDDRTHNLHNSSRSPFVGQQESGFNKLGAPAEANVARRSFEAFLYTLSRTKDSIGRATRVAIDCAKYGIAAEVIEILLQHLERESSLYKRVDLFFLVDSITQFSRSQKGGAGYVYLSLVQSVLPRLLSAAAPHGNAAWENRRQCLKVLRLWLERKILPESVVRHHIRGLESVHETLTCSYSRRPSRTERALNDPIREMEGMFVDEYGSNTSFHLHNFIHPRLLEEEDGSGDDEKSFEAVTPERNADVADDKGTTHTPNEKHRHILEDVDGELEMEDVAPPCEVEPSASCHVSGIETVSDVHYQRGQHQSLPCAPPLPEDLPPSPPPLPSSPPPMAPSCSAPLSLVPQQQLGGSHANTDHLCSTHSNLSQQPQSISHQPNNFQGNLVSSESLPYYTRGYGGFPKQIPPAPCPLDSSGPCTSHTAVNSGNNFHASLPNKAYPLQPPPPTVSNQFCYIQAESQQRAQSWGSCSSFGDGFQYVHGPQRGFFYGDRSNRAPIQHENAERGRFSPAINTGHVLSDKAEAMPSSLPRYGPCSESASNVNHGWPIPPRISSYSVSSSRSSMENPISRATGAPGYRRPR